jgi:hypothetical protein
MKSDFSNWSHKPDNVLILKKYAETAIAEGITGEVLIPTVVWRDSELTLTLTPQEGEQVYDIGIKDPRPKEEVDLGFEPIPDEEDSNPIKK